MERGIALVITLIALAVLSALAAGVLLTTAAERLTSGNYDDSVHALNAAETALELTARELSLVANWDTVLSGASRSRLVDGAPSGLRAIDDVSIDLTSETNRLTCGRTTACTDGQVQASTRDRSWGVNNPRWQLFLYGSLASMVHAPGAVKDAYVLVWVGDDAREVDGDPLIDGGGPGGEGRNVVRVRAEAVAAGGTRRAVEADVMRQAAGIRVQSWRVTSGLP
jgi:hypothetical protein